MTPAASPNKAMASEMSTGVPKPEDLSTICAVAAAIVAAFSFLRGKLYHTATLKRLQETLDRHARDTRESFKRVDENLEEVKKHVSALERKNEIEELEARVLQRLQDSNANRRGTRSEEAR
jgi:hypothetical protein